LYRAHGTQSHGIPYLLSSDTVRLPEVAMPTRDVPSQKGVKFSVSPNPQQTVSIPWWLRFVVLLGALLLAVGAFLALAHPAMLVSPHDEINGAVLIYAGYFASRNAALAIMLVLLLSLGATQALRNMMVFVALIQLFDACMDLAEGRWMLVPGVIVIGLVFLIGAGRLSSHSIWKATSWV
jgi:hypothetical protein